MSKSNQELQTPSSYNLNAFKARLIQERMSSLMGKVLTLADAALLEHQKKAFKDIVREAFGDEMNWFSEKQFAPDLKTMSIYGNDIVEYDVETVKGPLIEE